jgi:hypothetical protein
MNTHTDMHIMTKYHAGKTALCINNGKCLYILQGVPELSSALHALPLYIYLPTPKMRSEYLFYLRALSASLQVHLL